MSGSRWRRASGFVGLLLRDQTADPLCQERAVERLLERVVEPQREGFLAGFVAGQGEQNRAPMVWAFAKILRALTGCATSKGHVDNDAIGVKTLGTNPRFKARSSRLDTEIVGFAKMIAQDRLQRSVGSHNQPLMIN